MTPKLGTFESADRFLPKPKNEKAKTAEAKSDRLEELVDSGEHARAVEYWDEQIKKVSEGSYEEEYSFSDKQQGVVHMGDANTSIFAIDNTSPLLFHLREKLLKAGYSSKAGSNRTVFSRGKKMTNFAGHTYPNRENTSL